MTIISKCEKKEQRKASRGIVFLSPKCFDIYTTSEYDNIYFPCDLEITVIMHEKEDVA